MGVAMGVGQTGSVLAHSPMYAEHGTHRSQSFPAVPHWKRNMGLGGAILSVCVGAAPESIDKTLFVIVSALRLHDYRRRLGYNALTVLSICARSLCT